jgi:hypothetical protein
MSSLLEASRREIAEAYLVAKRQGNDDLALFWAVELVDRTVSLANAIFTQSSDTGTPEANSRDGEGE